MIARLLDDFRRDDRWHTEHLEFRFTPSFSTLRQAKFSKIFELLRVYLRLVRLFFRYGRVDLVIYPSGGPQAVPMVRDVLLLPCVRFVTKQLWVQFHAAGIADRLEQENGVLEVLLKAAYRGVDGAIVMTDYNRCDPLALGISAVEVIPHHLPDENTGGKLPDFSERPLRILHAGHLYDLKGTPQLVEAFGRVAGRFPDWRLVLMGEFLPPYSEGECRKRCRELGIEDKVEILGMRRDREKTDEFARAHVFVFASVAPYESFGLVMAEAMMWGLPMAVSRWRGNHDVAGSAAEYFEVGPLMAENLAGCLRGLLEEPLNLASKSRSSRERFDACYRQDGFVFCDLVARLIGLECKP